uniref:Peptidase S1 domain-containing protein n=1 Tax=Glossina brevipalpis TaxID=37001 RepID=A0A1A9WY18_9MUSC
MLTCFTIDRRQKTMNLLRERNKNITIILQQSSLRLPPFTMCSLKKTLIIYRQTIASKKEGSDIKPRQENELNLGLDYKNQVTEKTMPTEGKRYLVRLTWLNKTERRWEEETGVILKEDIILTHFAPDLSNSKAVGYCLLTFNSDEGVGQKNVRIWKKAARRYDSKKKEYYITLVKLITKIDLNGGFMSLPIYTEDELPKKDTNVIVFTPHNNEPVYTVAPLGCEKDLIKENLFCFTIENSTHNDIPDKLAPLVSGSPVLYQDKIIGVAHPRKILDSGSYRIIYVGNVYSHRNWINTTIKRLCETNFYSDVSKYMVFYGTERSIKGVAVIIQQKYILTNYASDSIFYNRFKFKNDIRPYPANDEMSESIEYGFIVYGTPNITIDAPPPSKNVITYKKRLPDRITSSNINDIKLIELDESIEFNRKARPLDLFKTKYPLKGARCYVVTPFTQGIDHIDFNYKNKFSFLQNEMKLSEIEVELWTYSMCKDYVKNLKKDQFCIRVHWEIDEGDHCRYIRSGTPVICDSMLVGIVNELKYCSEEMPRPCTNIHPHKEWIDCETRETEPKLPKLLEAVGVSQEICGNQSAEKESVKKESTKEESVKQEPAEKESLEKDSLEKEFVEDRPVEKDFNSIQLLLSILILSFSMLSYMLIYTHTNIHRNNTKEKYLNKIYGILTELEEGRYASLGN